MWLETVVVVYGRTTNTAVKKYNKKCAYNTQACTHIFYRLKIHGIGGGISS
jgi:hypothetical protein